jgi:hypothetical protein
MQKTKTYFFEEGSIMVKKMVVLAVVLIFAVSLGACKKKEPKPQLPPGHAAMEGMPAAGMPNVPKVERQVVVSKDVAEKWKAVKLTIENKAAKTTKDYTVHIGSELAVPDTNLTVKVLAFLPDFKMSDKEFYSASDKPNQPAAQVVVTENGKEIWSNWLFAKMPNIHPFQHEKVGILLVGGVSKK